jgi:hypothetical protein
MDEKGHCENCKYATRKTVIGPGGKIEIGVEVFVCQRFPPVPVMLATERGLAQLVSFFPTVDADMVCSLHEFVADGDGATVPAALLKAN